MESLPFVAVIFQPFPAIRGQRTIMRARQRAFSQEVSLASDTTGFHSINTIRATSDPNPRALVFDNFGDTQTNDNFGPAQVVFLGSDFEDKIEVMPTLPGNSQPKYSTDSINATDNEVESRRKPNKRPRLQRKTRPAFR
ncbi:hypothetical protein BKA61DRAFT_580462 [Leptodontidium sp. MPI-SDFR-AT-0119]|nr:hypothetical protein BKA61DRAFT_580462 [Leptodontidium sp. MPI-SDFR-AT-0119]